MEDRGLAVEADNASIDVRLPLKNTSVVDEIPARNVVSRVQHNIVFSDHIHRIRRIKPDFVTDDSYVWINLGQLLLCDIDLHPSNICLQEQELPLKVGKINPIGVYNSDSADSSRGKIDGGWNSESTEPNY